MQFNPDNFRGRFQAAAHKYVNAQVHLGKLNDMFSEFQEGQWWSAEPIEGDNSQVRIKLIRRPTTQWSLALGDFIHNLRGCLDYATCALVELTGEDSSLARVQFPFGRLGENLTTRDRQNIRTLGPGVVQTIEELRRDYRDDLHLVNLMSNQDKHRILLSLGIHRVPMRVNVDETTNTASILEDADAMNNGLYQEIDDGQVIDMPTILNMGLSIKVDKLSQPVRFMDVNRINRSILSTFVGMAFIPMSELGSPRFPKVP